MKPVYSSLAPQTGTLTPGFYQVQFAPREWLAADPVVDFATGTVSTAIAFVPGRSWLTFTFTPDSPDYNDKPKLGRGGPYREITFSGLLNSLDAATLQALATTDRQQLVVALHDKQKLRRLVGTTQVGMALTWEHKVVNGTETISLLFALEQEDSPPFYTA